MNAIATYDCVALPESAEADRWFRLSIKAEGKCVRFVANKKIQSLCQLVNDALRKPRLARVMYFETFCLSNRPTFHAGQPRQEIDLLYDNTLETSSSHPALCCRGMARGASTDSIRANLGKRRSYGCTADASSLLYVWMSCIEIRQSRGDWCVDRGKFMNWQLLMVADARR